MATYIGTRLITEINFGGFNDEIIELTTVTMPFTANFINIDYVNPDKIFFNFDGDLIQAETDALDTALAGHDRTDYDSTQEELDKFPDGDAAGIFYRAGTQGTTGLVGITVTEALDEALLRADNANNNANTRESSFSGLVAGGNISMINDTTILVSSGEGRITDSYTDPNNATETIVNWSDTQILFTTQELTDKLLFRIIVDSTGIIIKQTSLLSPAQLRNNILIGTVVTDLEGKIVSILGIKIIHNNTLSLLIDNLAIDGISVISGRLLTKSDVGTSLQVKISEGEVFGAGINWNNERNNPNRKFLDAIDPINIVYVKTNSNSYIKIPTEEIDAQLYDEDFQGTLVNVKGGRSTNQKVFLVLGSLLVIQYSGTEHKDFDKALENLAEDSINWVDTPLTDGLSHIGWLTVSEDLDDILDKKQFKFTRITSGAVQSGGIFAEAIDITYDNSTSGLSANNVQHAIDELDVRLDTLEENAGTNGDITLPLRAIDVKYDNIVSSLTASNVQKAVDELENIKISQVIDDSNPTLSGDLVSNSNSIFLNGVSGRLEGIQWHTGDKTTMAYISHDLDNNVYQFASIATGNISISTILPDEVQINTNGATVKIGSNADVFINNLKYPVVDGLNSQVISTDGLGNLSFSTIPIASVFSRTGDIVAGNGDYNATQITLDDTNLDYTTNNVQTGFEGLNIITKTKVTTNTGLTDGGLVTEASTTTFSVDDGSGWIIDAVADPTSPTGQKVIWSNLTDISLSMNGPTGTTYILINSAGNILQLETKPTENQTTSNVYLAAIVYDQFVIKNVINVPDIVNSTSNNFADLISFLPPVSRIQGLSPTIIIPSTTFEFWVTAGTAFVLGASYHTDKYNPNKLQFPSAGDEFTPTSFTQIDSNGNEIYNRTILQNQQWDNNGNIENLGNKKATTQYIFELVGIGVFVLYGQIEHKDFMAAQSQISSEINHIKIPSILETATLVGAFSSQTDADDFTETNKVALVSMSAGGGQGFSASGAGDMQAVIYDPTNVVGDSFDYNNFHNTKDDYATITTTTTTEEGRFYILNAANNSLEFHLNIPTDGDRNRFVLEDVTNPISIIADGNIPIDGSVEPIIFSSTSANNRLYEIIYVKTINEWKLYELGAFNRTPVESILVSVNGDDTTTSPNLFAPFKTIKAAVEYAKAIASKNNPIKIEILPGVYVENNPITIDNGFINLVGSGSSTTIVLPENINEPILSLKSSEKFGGSDIINIGFYGSTEDFVIESSSIKTLFNRSYSLPYRSSLKFNLDILNQISMLNSIGVLAIDGTSGTDGTAGVRIKNIAAIELNNLGAYNISNCDFVSFEKGISVNTMFTLDKIYMFAESIYFENNDICINTDGSNMNIQIDGAQAYNNINTVYADNQSFISVSNFTIDNFDIFENTQDDPAIKAINQSLVLLKAGYVFNVGVIIHASFGASVLGDVIDAQNVNIGYICDEGAELNIPNTTVNTKNVTILVPSTGNNSKVIINNLNSQNTIVSEIQLLSFNSEVTISSATMNVENVRNEDIINWTNLSITFNTPVIGNFFYNDVLVGSALKGRILAIGNGGTDFNNTEILLGPDLSSGTNGLEYIPNNIQFEYDTTTVGNSLYFTSNNELNNVPILWHTAVFSIASPLDYSLGGKLIFEIYDGETMQWSPINNMVSNSSTPYSSVGKNKCFSFLDECLRISTDVRDFWGRAETPLIPGVLLYWARIRVIEPFATTVTLNSIGIIFNTAIIREDGVFQFYGTARPFNYINGFDVNMLQETPIGDPGTGVGFWADQSFFITRTLNTMLNNVSTTFNYVIPFSTVTDTSSPIYFILKIVTNDDQGGNFNFKIRMSLVQDGMTVYTNKNDAPVYEPGIIEVENTYIAPTVINSIKSYFIPMDISNFIPINHDSRLGVIGSNSSLGVNITRDGIDLTDTHNGDISIINIEHHTLKYSGGQSSAQFVDTSKNIGKSYIILFIARDIEKLDKTEKDVINAMQAKAIIVRLLKDSNVTESSWRGYDLVYISSTAREDRISIYFNSVPIGVLINRIEVLINMNLVLANNIGTKSDIRDIIISNDIHYITEPYSSFNIVRITKDSVTYSYITTSTTQRLATLNFSRTENVLLQWDLSDSDLGNTPMTERRVFFGYGSDTDLRDGGVDLIGRSLDWLLHFDER